MLITNVNSNIINATPSHLINNKMGWENWPYNIKANQKW